MRAVTTTRRRRCVRWAGSSLAIVASLGCGSARQDPYQNPEQDELRVQSRAQAPDSEVLPRDCGWSVTKFDAANVDANAPAASWLPRVKEIGRARTGVLPKWAGRWSDLAGAAFRVELRPVGSMDWFVPAHTRVQNPRKICRPYIAGG